jgi:GTP:adenosylcobinamide-phosphate guanylyltransferase
VKVILTAGGIPKPDEPLYPFTLGGYKAMLDVAGKPMIQWVLDALSGSELIDHVVVIGLPTTNSLVCTKRLSFIENQAGMIENILAGIEFHKKETPQVDEVLIVASDIPAITPKMVDWLVKIVGESDSNVFYNVISRQVMESQYPGSHRTYVRLKDIEACGGDMNAIRTSALFAGDSSWKRLVDARKSPIKQASILGFDLLLGVMLHFYSLSQVETLVSKRLGIRAKALICPYAEVGMDVDKPHQLEIMRLDLAHGKPA